MADQFILDIVHPGTYFHDFGQDKEFFERVYGERFDRLKQVVDLFVRREHLIVSMMKMSATISDKITNAATSMNFETKGLQFISQTSRYNVATHYESSYSGVPFNTSVIEDDSLVQEIRERMPDLLTDQNFRDRFDHFADNTHLIVGGLLGNCVINWVGYMRDVYPETKVYCIDELCVTSSAQDLEESKALFDKHDLNLVSLDEVMAMLQ